MAARSVEAQTLSATEAANEPETTPDLEVAVIPTNSATVSATSGHTAALIGSGLMRIVATRLSYQTSENLQFIDLTDDVQAALTESAIDAGLLTVYSQHTTAAIKINENEPLLLNDLADFLRRVAPRERLYRHNDFTVRVVNMQVDESPNAHSHCQHLVLSTSESIPVAQGRLQLGRWQRIFLIELDRPRPRDILLQIMGC